MTTDNIQVHSALREPSKSVTGEEKSLSHCPCGKMADLRAKVTPQTKLTPQTSYPIPLNFFTALTGIAPVAISLFDENKHITR